MLSAHNQMRAHTHGEAARSRLIYLSFAGRELSGGFYAFFKLTLLLSAFHFYISILQKSPYADWSFFGQHLLLNRRELVSSRGDLQKKINIDTNMFHYGGIEKIPNLKK